MSQPYLLPPTIGRYEATRVLGQGAMGRVLLARDPILNRDVAIKILRDDLGLPPPASATAPSSSSTMTPSPLRIENLYRWRQGRSSWAAALAWPPARWPTCS